MRSRLAALLGAALLGGLPALNGSPAHALSCVGPRDVTRDAAHVFTGTILDSADDRLLVDVGEIWAGGPVLNRVWLPIEAEMELWYPWATPDGTIPDGYSSDRTWVLATDGDFTVGACSAWELHDDHAGLMALRPDHPAAPVQAILRPLDEEPAAIPDRDRRASGAAAALGGGVAAAGAMLVLHRRRSRR